MSKSTITLDNFAEWHGEVRGVEIHSFIPLPEYVPTTDIAIDLGRIATIARYGRLKSVRFGLYDEEEKMSFSISGVNKDGAATATGAKSATVSRSNSELNRESGEGYVPFPRGTASIKVNARHPDLNDTVLRKPEPWATLLDKGMRGGLAEASRKQLLEPKLERRVYFGIHQAVTSFIVGGYYALTQEPEVIPILCGMYALDDALGIGSRLGAKARKMPFDDYEHSVLKDLPLDRYAAARALTATKKIVTVT